MLGIIIITTIISSTIIIKWPQKSFSHSVIELK